MSRYNNRRKAINREESYDQLFEDRGVKEIEQYSTPTLKFPSDDEVAKIKYLNYTWKQGDRFWKLASLQYGDPSLWWIIAQFNKKPTEAHLNPGDVIKIPSDKGVILGALS
jgi:nucleoid-associated protein YgaU